MDIISYRQYVRRGGVTRQPYWVAKKYVAYTEQYEICLVARVLDTSSLNYTSNDMN